MDVKSPYSDIFSQVDDVKDIQIKSFSCVEVCRNEHIHFVRKKHFYGQLYAVHVYPSGTSNENQGFVSIKVSKILKDPKAIPDVAYDYITWTFSVMDINGYGRYYQSVAKESVVNLPYQIEMPKFMKRSLVLDRVDELLPRDKLTIRCEVSFVFYSIQALSNNLVFDVNQHLENKRSTESFDEISKVKENSDSDSEDFEADAKFGGISKNEDAKFELNLNINHAPESGDTKEVPGRNLNLNEPAESLFNEGHRLFDNEEDMIYYMLIMLSFLHEYRECKQRRRLYSKDFKFQIRLLSKILVNTDITDDIIRTYMWKDPIFKTYIHLKSKVKYILNKFPLVIKEEESLENEKYNHHPIYTGGNYLNFMDSWTLLRKIFKAIKHVNNSTDKCVNEYLLYAKNKYKYKLLLKSVAKKSKKDSMWGYLFEALKLNESYDSEEQDTTNINSNKDTKWYLQIETKDGAIFRIPFEEDKETFGSKLVASSPVFESMLRNPMVERLRKRVELLDTDFRTFRNFLQFLQGSGVVTNSFSELCDLYEFADKYTVEDLMFDCGLMFMPFLNEETVSEVEALARMHSDDFLLGAVKTLKNEHSHSLVNKDDDKFGVKRSSNSSFEEKRSDFDFYR